MTEMVQRVARALAQLEGHENLPTLQSAYEQRARVAIEAMRGESDYYAFLRDLYLALLAHPHDMWRTKNQRHYTYVRDEIARLTGVPSEEVQNVSETIACALEEQPQ